MINSLVCELIKNQGELIDGFSRPQPHPPKAPKMATRVEDDSDVLAGVCDWPFGSKSVKVESSSSGELMTMAFGSRGRQIRMI
jgi:hypothetical protein